MQKFKKASESFLEIHIDQSISPFEPGVKQHRANFPHELIAMPLLIGSGTYRLNDGEQSMLKNSPTQYTIYSHLINKLMLVMYYQCQLQ